MKTKMYFYHSIVLMLTVFLFQIVSANINIVKASENDDVETLVVGFLESLRNGDTDGVLNSITDPLLHDRKVLLERNPNYASVLVEAYKDINFRIERIEDIDRQYKSAIVQYFSNNRFIKKTKFICKKEDSSWKITEEVLVINLQQ